MAEEERPRTLKVLDALSELTEPTSPADIGSMIGVSPRDTGKTLYDLGKGGLAEKPDEKQSLWLITDKGRKYRENPPVLSERPLEPTLGPTLGPTTQTELTPPITTDTIPSQSDLFRREGELLGVGVKKGEIHLDTIVKWVQRTANLDDLSSVWNALTEMNVANDVKKRWIKLYAQNLPGKEVPEALKEKLEAGQETEKVAKAEAGEIAPKPKRFSVISDQIIGDPEGDYNFKEALQVLAQQKGVPVDQAGGVATMVSAILEATKQGPAMATATLTAIIPLLTKEPPKPDNTIASILQQQTTVQQQQVQLLQQRIEQLAEDKHKAEMEAIRAEIRTGQRPPETDQRLEAFTKQIETLRESLHQEQLTRITEQSQRTAELLQGEIKRLEERVTQASQSQRVESSLGILSKAIDKVDSQLSGIRGDAKPLVETIMKAGGPGPAPRSPEEKARLATIGKEAVLKERRARQLEDELLSG